MLRLTVNGQLAATARDDTDVYTGTGVGVVAVTWYNSDGSSSPVDARFSNFKVDQLS